MTTLTIPVNGIHLEVISAGPDSGPLLIFLHGFPEFSFSWKNQIEFFARAGFRVLAPNQRGYGLSERPQGVHNYRYAELAKDVAGLIDWAKQGKAYLVGHDWGGIVTWWTALLYPERLKGITVLNAPHPWVMRKHLTSNLDQIKKSWYIFFSAIPQVPEWYMTRNRAQALCNTLQKTSRPGTFSSEELERYRENWLRPGALTAMINWYRANLIGVKPTQKSPIVQVPTQLIWGTRDRFLGRELAQPSIEFCKNGRLNFIEGASHWVQHEEPTQINEFILENLSRNE